MVYMAHVDGSIDHGDGSLYMLEAKELASSSKLKCILFIEILFPVTPILGVHDVPTVCSILPAHHDLFG